MPLARAHEESVDTLTKAHLDRHARGEKHPVWDFIFDYYRNSPGKFRRWHPGAGIAIAGACPHANWKYYVSDGDITWCDTDAFLAKRGKTARYVANLLRATTAHTAHYDCFCLHSWDTRYASKHESFRKSATISHNRRIYQRRTATADYHPMGRR